MMRWRSAFVPALLWGLLAAWPALAADHVDSSVPVGEPPADITDVFAWMSPDAGKVYLVMNVFPFATAEAKFSDQVQYVFHLSSAPTFGGEAQVVPVICTFSTDQTIQCWGGGEYVTGDGSDPAGIASENGKLRVFAGLRNDPFFFNLTGFQEVVATVKSVAGDLTRDAAGCPDLTPETATALATQLAQDADQNPATDSFAGANVLSLVVAIDKAAVTPGGPILGVWGSTRRTPSN